jgi:hypothetical protein
MRKPRNFGLVVILGNDGEPCSLGVSLNGCSLPLITVLVGPNIGRTGGAEIRHGWLQFLRHFPLFPGRLVPLAVTA